MLPLIAAFLLFNFHLTEGDPSVEVWSRTHPFIFVKIVKSIMTYLQLVYLLCQFLVPYVFPSFLLPQCICFEGFICFVILYYVGSNDKNKYKILPENDIIWGKRMRADVKEK